MISTRSVELVIDTVVCLTLAKWETVSGQFGGYLTSLVLVDASRFRDGANSTARSLRDSLEASRKAGRSNMEQILINLVTGALGGVAVGKSSPTFDLGMIGNIISGLIGGGVLGQVVTLLLPAITAAAQSGNLSVEGIISQVIAGGAGGAILTAIIGAIKNKAAA